MDLREGLQKTLGSSLTLEEELGGGGMSRVFLAHDNTLGRKVVVKVLPPEMAAAVNVDRFRREIQLAAQLQHPHIVPLLAAGDTDGLPYYTMPYVRGESLRARLSKAGELPLSQTVRILREVASALAYAHEAGVVHRDIKPENILISGGSAVVTDFGVAKALTASSGEASSSLTSLGVALGTPAYMAPEQASADPNVDYRADIYSLGIVAYEMLSGSTPFPGRSPQATLAAHVTEQPDQVTKRRATVPPLLAALVMRCLEKHAADRPQSATDVMHELDALTTPSGGTTPTTLQPATPKKKSRMPLIAAGIVVVALGVGATMRWLPARSAKGEERPAVAVLPFENVGKKDGEDFTDGMTEEITNRLSTLKGLRVIGRQSAKTYANTTKTPQQIGEELGAKYLLTGTVRWDKSGDGKDVVRVSPALVKADDATQVWGDAYQTVLSGVFDVQSRIASEVASALDLNLLAPETSSLAEHPTENLEAFAAYTRGRRIVDETYSVTSFGEAISLLERATALDPKFASAWAKLAQAHSEYFWYQGDRTSRRLKMASDALEKSASLDRDNPDLHLARGIYLYHGLRDFDGALAELRTVEQLRPSDPFAPVWLGAIYRRQGKWDEAEASFRKSVELDPRNGANVYDYAHTLYLRNKFDEAVRYADQAAILAPEEVTPVQSKVLIALASRGDVQQALRFMREGVRAIPRQSDAIGLLQVNTWPAVEDPQLRQMLIDAKRPNDQPKSIFYYSKALLYFHLGDKQRRLAYVDSTIAAGTEELKDNASPAQLYQYLANAAAMRGDRDLSARYLAKAREAVPASRDAYLELDRLNSEPVMLTWTGDYDAALSLLEKRVNVVGGYTKPYLRIAPEFAPLRSNPRFQALIR